MGTLFPRIKCPGRHICLGKSVRGDTLSQDFVSGGTHLGGDTIYYDIGTTDGRDETVLFIYLFVLTLNI